MQQSRIRSAAAFMVPFAALSFSGCDEDGTKAGEPSSALPEPPVAAAVEKLTENRAPRNEVHKNLVAAMKVLDGSLVELIDSSTYSPGHSPWYRSNRNKLANTLKAIDEAYKEVLSVVDASPDKLELLSGYSRTLGEARGALDFVRTPTYDWIPDGGYHTLHGLLAQNRFIIRALCAPPAAELF